MKVSDCMTPDVRVTSPNQTIQEAARAMCELDAGVLPVGEGDRLIGMITDRDIAIRAIAEGRGPDCPVRDIMTSEVRYCFDDESVEDVAQNMGDLQLRRLPVLNREKRLVGIVTLGDLACTGGKSKVVGEALGEISRSGGPNSQAGDGMH